MADHSGGHGVINLIITGAAGRMGSRIAALALEDSSFRLVGAVEHPGHPAMGKDLGETLGRGALGLSLEGDLAAVLRRGDVVVDFTAPEVSLTHCRLAAAQRKALVIGTTGLTAKQREEIAGLASAAPCVLAPNMSIGVNLLAEALRLVSRTLGEAYDVEIVEAHHRLKKDAPSGTALLFARTIAETLGWKLDDVAVYGRQGQTGERPARQIAIHALRGGEIVGDHTVTFAGPGEVLEFSHRALSRDLFARGALRAAQWVVRRKPGLYDMADVLGLKEK
jgi:4-hydroxy-tetrahydrodipicolinate reductase